MTKKTVMYISPNGYLGGAEKVVLTLAQAHTENIKFNSIIMFFSSGEAVEAAKLAGIKTIVLKNSFRLSRPFSLFRALIEIRAAVNSLSPDIIHSTMAYSHLVVSAACLGKNIKKVWFQHGPVGELLDKLASLFPVDCLMFNSDFLKIKHHKSYPKVNIHHSEHVIPLGVTHQGPERVNPVFSKEIMMIGSAGRICSGKAFDLIIMTLGELHSEGKLPPFIMILAGNAKTSTDQIYLNYIKSLVDKHGLGEHITFPGHIDDMNSFYNSIDLFIHATIEPEPFGLVIAEAMAHGCLVLASDKGGAGELITNGINGFSYNCTDTGFAKENLKKEILTILFHDHEHLQKCALEGKIFIRKKYSVSAMINIVENIYLRLL